MPGIATGEVFAFSEGKLYLYASASGTTSGSGIGFAEGAQLTLSYGWLNYRDLSGLYHDLITGQRADLSIDHLYADRVLMTLANGTAAVNAKFEGLVTGAGLGKSAQHLLYSGVIDQVTLTQTENDLFRGRIAMHANTWSAIGQ